MTDNEEKIYNRFVFWLSLRSERDEEDIHEFQFSTQDCIDLLAALTECILDKKCNHDL